MLAWLIRMHGCPAETTCVHAKFCYAAASCSNGQRARVVVRRQGRQADDPPPPAPRTHLIIHGGDAVEQGLPRCCFLPRSEGAARARRRVSAAACRRTWRHQHQASALATRDGARAAADRHERPAVHAARRRAALLRAQHGGSTADPRCCCLSAAPPPHTARHDERPLPCRSAGRYLTEQPSRAVPSVPR